MVAVAEDFKGTGCAVENLEIHQITIGATMVITGVVSPVP